MERRAYQRTPTYLYARYFYGNLSYTGIITNLSENGMYIKTRKCLPVISKSKVLIPLIDDVLKVPVEIKRVIRMDNGMCKGMGIELLDRSQNYLELVGSLRSFF